MAPSARRAAFLVIAGVWAVSLALPAIELPSGAVHDGAELLRRGWEGGRVGVFAWYANPLFLVAVVCGAAERLRVAGVLSGAAFLLGCTSFAAAPLARSGGAPVPMLDFGVGFYVWLGALFALCAWSWLAVAVARRQRAETTRITGISPR